jgi:hypothetical protein
MKKQVKFNISNKKLLNNINTPAVYDDTPEIFNKKRNKIMNKPLEFITNDTGKTRHYPPAAQE